MHILIAPDKFRGSLTARRAAEAIARGIEALSIPATTAIHPLADGGEGSLEAIHAATGGRFVSAAASDPLGRPISARYLVNGKSAYIEMAAASGLALLADEERNCSNTTTYGTGLLIRHALENGATSIYLCLGGSATCDGGTGMAAALGYTFEDINGDELYPAGRNLDRIERIVPSGRMSLVRDAAFTVLADVRNPLFGPEGAAFVYAPQKGAGPGEVKHLDAGLRNLSALVVKLLNRNLGGVPGAGAAGGLGFGAMAFLDAKLIAGSAEILRITGFRDKINGADLVITGEGRLDEQSKQGKVVSAVLDVARSCNKPVGILCGTNALPHGDAFLDNFFEVSSLAEFSDTLEEAVNNPEKYIEKALDKLIVAFRSI